MTDVAQLAARLADGELEDRVAAARALATHAVHQPDDVAAVTPVLAVALDDADQRIRRAVAWTFADLGKNCPKPTAHATRALTVVLEDDDRLVRASATCALAGVASEHPDAVRDAVDPLFELLEDADYQTRTYAAAALRSIATAFEEVRPAIYPRLADLSPAEIDGDAYVVDVTGDPEPTDTVTRRFPNDDQTPNWPTPQQSVDGPPSHIPEERPVDLSPSTIEPVETLVVDDQLVVQRARVPRSDGPDGTIIHKTLRIDDTADDFERAVRWWHGVHHHDFIATVVDAGTDSLPWVAIEYLDDDDFGARVGNISLPHALWILDRIAAAVEHAHALGVTHLGLKPSNVGFTDSLEAAWSVPKVTDWGLTVARSGPERSGYAAPEQVEPETFGHPDHLTDVYRLGLLTYELVTGVSAPERQRFLVEDPASPLPPVTDEDPSLPTALDALVARATAPPKSNRYETVTDLRRDLNRLSV